MKAGCIMAAWATALLLAASAGAQQVTAVSVGNAPDSGADAPADEGGKAADRGGLAGRGGGALAARRTFGQTIGTSIYTPIGSSIYTPVQRPPSSDRPQP